MMESNDPVLETLSVLVVDDEREFADTLGERLATKGLAVRVAYSAAQALELATLQAPDVVLLDVQMPGQSGLDSIEPLLAVAPFTQIILLTASHELSTAVLGMQRGACDYLTKPASLPQLLEAVRNAARRKSSREETGRMLLTQRLASYGAFARSIAHEINNPLAIIIQEAELCEEQLEDEEQCGEAFKTQLQQSLASIQRQARRGGMFTRSLLNFGAQAAPLYRETSICNLLEEAAERIRERAEPLGVRLRVDCLALLPRVVLPVNAVARVLDNLTDNALRAMAEQGGELLLRASELPPSEGAGATGGEQGALLLEVLDQGAGIPPQILHRVCEPFFSTRAEGESLGLGLSISYGMVQSLGGRLQVENRPEGGVRVSIRLPLKRN